MREFVIKQGSSNINEVFVAEIAESEGYKLILEKESMLKKILTIHSFDGNKVATIHYQHILFERAKLPKLEIVCNTGQRAIVKKDIHQLCDVINISGDNLKVQGDVYSDKFEILIEEEYVATYYWKDRQVCVSVDSDNEVMAVAIAFSIQIAK